ncbi:hypothetical protein EFK50_19405 [Nocardioides marmoriginsengisoli]|uniref:DUF4097 domain-containing protein n=1 Tax=Nocardioides marmoriginsengisoli TaxID=661483 RepID=A0A3N0CAI8_9ACTN|nr:DUF4097 family beta strand repeat-containing protein [Nocardioides marmoriginsengisoli]RNL60492.1 hypothetical protein EFK50_19405 [Nocardioides marmoriginsengisoli]
MRKTFTTPEPVNLYVELGSGQLATICADVTEAVVEIDGSRAEEFVVEQNGKQLAVVAPRGRFFGHGDAHRVRITVPNGSALVTKTGSADTTSSGTLGSVKIKTGSGDVEVERADGPVVIETGSGDVKAGELAGAVRIKSGSGDVQLGDVHGTTGISTGSGDVVLDLVHDTVVMKTGSGDLQVNRAEADLSLTTASGDVTVGHALRGKVTAKNVSGDVRVGISSGTPVWTDISTVTGSVANRLDSVGKPAEGQDYVELRASTVSGDVHLQQV